MAKAKKHRAPLKRTTKPKAAEAPVEVQAPPAEEPKAKEPCKGGCVPKCDAHASPELLRARSRKAAEFTGSEGKRTVDRLAPVDDDMVNARDRALVRKNFHGYIALQLRIEGPDIEYLLVDELGEGGAAVKRVDCHTAPRLPFMDDFKPVEGYPVERAARLYVGYAMDLGATEEAMDELAKLVVVSETERSVAVGKNKKPGISSKKAKEPKAKEGGSKSVRGGKPAKEKAPKGLTKASRISELLMEEGEAGVCKHTNNEIVDVLKEEFGVAEGDREKQVKNIAWYRSNLARNGKNPPKAKREKKEAAEA